MDSVGTVVNVSHGHSASRSEGVKSDRILTSTVLVSALGYFVDIYDLLLFGIVRVPSLRGLGLSEKEVLEVGIRLVNTQMIGMLVGGILWGVLGDKKGRVSVLFGSILIYSIANILNAFVTSVDAYAALRFVAGVGLAGELGAAITLVSETLSKEHRGYGNTIVAGVGLFGAVCASLIGDFFSWQTAYLVGGGLGLLLLVMRISISESGIFSSIQNHEVKKGDLRMLFYPMPRFLKYLRCILVAVPIWFVIGIPVSLAPELAKELGIVEAISAGKAILFCYFGGAFGNLTCGLMSQWMRSRRNVIFLFLALILCFTAACLFTPGLTPNSFYALCALLGFATGYWVVFMTITAEQFGTNLRATVTTTVPNFVRASIVVQLMAFQALRGSLSMVQSAWWVGAAAVGLAFISLIGLKDTYGKDLEYLEG